MASTQRSNIEVFFSVLGTQRVRKAFKDLEAAAARTALAGPRSAFGLANTLGRRTISTITSLVKNLGGIAPAVRLGASAVSSLYTGLQRATIGATALAVAGAGIGRAFSGIYESTAELTSVVLALRAVNNEVGKGRDLPLFAPDLANGGLLDASGGVSNARGRNVYFDNLGRQYAKQLKDSVFDAASDLAFLNKVAGEHGISVRSLGKDYATLKASSIGSLVDPGDIRLMTEAIADAALVLGRTPAEVHRANIALGQIASKGQVYAEELKGQLAEAIPGAIPVAAKAYGVTVRQFNKMVEKGQVDSASFFSKFSRQLKSEYGEAAKSAANTTRVAAGQLANAWFNAKVAIGSGDLDKMFMRILKAATRLFEALTKNGSFNRFGSQLAKSLELLVVRFENAVNGGYDFERVLKIIGKAFDGLVRGVNLALDVIGNLSRGLRNLREFFKSYGLEVPSLAQGIRNIAAGFEEFTAALKDRRWSDNGYVNFFLGLYDAIEAVVTAIARLIFPASFLDDGLTMAERFDRAGKWLEQFALALTSLSTGQVSPDLDETGIGILVNLTAAVDTVRELIKSFKELKALLSGDDAPGNADFATKQRFAVRDKLADLFMGRPNEAKTDGNGTELLSEDSFNVLFKARDLFVSLIEYLDENKERLKDFFDGALSAMEAVLDIGKGIAAVFKEMGIDANVAYLAGFLYIMNKILPIGKILKWAFTAVAGALGIGVAKLGTFLVVAGLIVFMVAKIVSNWGLLRDEIGNIVTLIGSGFKTFLAGILRQLADFVKDVPLIGDAFADVLQGGAKELDKSAVDSAKAAAVASKKAADERARLNGGEDPFADGAKGAFDGEAFGEGFKLFFKDLLGTVGSPNVANASGPAGLGLQTINAITQAALKDDPVKKIAERTAAKREEMSPVDKQLFDSFNGEADPDGLGMGTAYTKPVNIYLSEGVEIELRGKDIDGAKFEELAARTAKNRASMTPAWGN